MNKVWKAISIVGNVSEVIIASAMVADLISKIRGTKKATIPKTEAEESSQPETPMAA